MNEILTQRLVGMSIVGSDGTTIGTLSNITLDLESGALRALVVEPHERFASSPAVRPDDDGRLRIPVERLESVTDRIVVRWDAS